MPATKADIIARLQKEILPLQGYKNARGNETIEWGLGPINHAFPHHSFPVGAIHEFYCNGAEAASASAGFIAALLSGLMRTGRICLWISCSRMIFPPALKSFGLEPDKIIFIDLEKEKDILWAMEEALKYEGLAAVIGEIKEISFTVSRRLQLAVEQSGVTGFILRCDPKYLHTTACISRWKISPLPSLNVKEMPGIGFPSWNLELIKIRNGHPGNWQIEWKAGRFNLITKLAPISRQLQKKTG
ncbi:MAG TPA: Error-prone repair protein ImuA [Chitinophagaceae bacterium]|nr:Error-prone repair protein ImuA [Chitinophagaceae bacterium]